MKNSLIFCIFTSLIFSACTHSPKRNAASTTQGDDLVCSSKNGDIFLNVRAHNSQYGNSSLTFIRDKFEKGQYAIKYLDTSVSGDDYVSLYVSPSLHYLNINSKDLEKKTEAQEIEDAKRYLKSLNSSGLMLVVGDGGRSKIEDWTTQEIFNQKMKIFTVWKDDAEGYRVTLHKASEFSCSLSNFSGEGGG